MMVQEVGDLKPCSRPQKGVKDCAPQSLGVLSVVATSTGGGAMSGAFESLRDLTFIEKLQYTFMRENTEV